MQALARNADDGQFNIRELKFMGGIAQLCDADQLADTCSKFLIEAPERSVGPQSRELLSAKFLNSAYPTFADLDVPTYVQEFIAQPENSHLQNAVESPQSNKPSNVKRLETALTVLVLGDFSDARQYASQHLASDDNRFFDDMCIIELIRRKELQFAYSLFSETYPFANGFPEHLRVGVARGFVMAGFGRCLRGFPYPDF